MDLTYKVSIPREVEAVMDAMPDSQAVGTKSQCYGQVGNLASVLLMEYGQCGFPFIPFKVFYFGYFNFMKHARDLIWNVYLYFFIFMPITLLTAREPTSR
jgi:hypothetical protein